VGATVGVALLEGKASSTNWPLFGKAIVGWIFTMVISGSLTAIFFSIGYASIQFDDTQVLSRGWQGSPGPAA
jgi:phosphate/sulfate permease